MDDIEDLIITPFREIVEKGKTAIGNAGDHEAMVKAATALVKEGERALRRLEPLCKKHVDDYGANFVISVKQNDDIACYRTELTDLLWEFDDFTNVESFEIEKFSQLQSLSRKAAPKIYDILMRMNLGPPGFFPSMSTPTIHGDHPSGSLWDVSSGVEGNRLPKATEDSRESTLAESPVLPYPDSDTDHKTRHSATEPPPLGSSSDKYQATPQTSEKRSLNNARVRSARTIAGLPPDRHPTISSQTIPTDASSERAVSPRTASFKATPQAAASPTFLQRSRTMSFARSGDEQDHKPATETALQPSHDNRMSSTSSSSHGTSRQSTSTLEGFSPVSIPAPLYNSGLEVVAPPTILEVDDGLIPVETEEMDAVKEKQPESPRLEAQVTLGNCTIGLDSSFHRAQGFCGGAKEVMRGGVGVRKTKKPVGYSSDAIVARCVECLYELDFGEIDADVSRQDKGNFTRNGINFRVRFLQKSHIATKRVDDVQYACIFCVQQGHTIDPSDATVFFSQKTLFEHLARHPRPLPEVQGLVIVQVEDIPEQFRNNYDIHFRKPPQRHPVIERAAEMVYLPTAVAREHARRLYGQRLLYDRTPALELAQGARITGITWPSQYHGEWAFGWHDGVWASVPSDLLRLDPPPKKQLKYDGMSLVRAKARWKFVQKDKDKEVRGEWLKFDKNEVISNIGWSFHEHWCWTGTNSKGKTGMFPSAFIDMSSLQVPTNPVPSRAISVYEEKSKSLSVRSMFSSRKASTAKPPSIAESSSSHGTEASSKKKKKRMFTLPG